ncbi:MAG: glycosyltransferase family 39 protein [Anaerolineae bacterium]|nr:glycosyltransferase family 39 protein [Anaerolineae bacterium]
MTVRRAGWWGLLLGLLLLAFAVRVVGITTQSLWRDEVDALRFARAPLVELVASFSRQGWNGPLYYVLLRLWIALAGQSAFALRYLSLCCGVLAVALIYRIGCAWFSRPVGLWAALLVATSPYMVWYSQEAKMYALICLLAPAILYGYYRALRDCDWRKWVLVIGLIWVAIAVHIMGGLLVPVMAILLIVWRRFARASWRVALFTLAAIVAPAVVAMPWVLPTLIRGGDIGHRFVDLPAMGVVMLHAFSRGVMPHNRAWSMGLALFGLLAGTLLWTDNGLVGAPLVGPRTRLGLGAHGADEGAHVLALWTWVAMPVLGLYAISLRVPMFVDRYLIWIGPAFYLLVARGLDQVRRRSTVIAIVCGAALIWLNGQGIVQQTTTPIKADLRAAAAYVEAHREPGDLVLFHISYIRYTFEYYYGDAAPWADGVATDAATSEATVDALMRERTRGREVVWLVLSEPEMWDARGMTVAWLEAHALVEERHEWARVSLIRYRLLHEAGG